MHVVAVRVVTVVVPRVEGMGAGPDEPLVDDVVGRWVQHSARHDDVRTHPGAGQVDGVHDPPGVRVVVALARLVGVVADPAVRGVQPVRPLFVYLTDEQPE